MFVAATRIPRIPTSTAAPPGRATTPMVVLATALALVAAPAFAATYKWTDANGRVVYSDQPPPGNVKVESIAGPPPPANPDAVKELAVKEAEVKQKKMLRAEEDAKAAKARVEDDKKREQCTKVRNQIALMQSNVNIVYRTNANGEQMLMDEAARRIEREQLEAWSRENCSP
jgi:Skp family chaperone for outer membrane proteins